MIVWFLELFLIAIIDSVPEVGEFYLLVVVFVHYVFKEMVLGTFPQKLVRQSRLYSATVLVFKSKIGRKEI